jgi:hypothetical protein
MERRVWIAWIALVCAAAAAACSDANVAGDYNAQITNGNDGCSLGLTPGTNAAADFTVTQSGSDVTLEVEGLAGLFLASQVGAAVLTGSVDGDELDVERQGTLKKTSMSCEYTVNARIQATLEGDAMRGRVEYRAATNGHADCGSRESCVTVQDFNATRPPAPQ